MNEQLPENISILIIEDEEAVAQSMMMSLESFGFNVEGVANDLDSALALLNKKTFDIALVDVNLHGKNSGLQLGKMLSDHYRLPYIFITGLSDKEVLEEAVKANPAAYLIKPANPASLFVTIQRAIQNFNTQTAAKHAAKDEPDFFFIKKKSGYQKIEWKSVVALISEQNYTRIVLVDNSDCLIRSTLVMTLKYIIPKHLTGNFVQINRSEAVQVSYIQRLDEEDIVTPLKTFAVTKGFQKEVKQRLNILH